MKRLLIILISIISLALMYSCEEDQVGPTLNLTNAVAPSITTPADGISLVLTLPEAETQLVIEWTAVDYKMEDIPNVKYTVTLAYPSEGLEITLASTDTTVTKITYQSLNFKLFDNFGLEPEDVGDFVIKVTASISDNSTSDDLASSPVNISITTYDDEPPPAKPIYLLGNATAAGWNNTAALEMTHIEAGLYEIIATLDGEFIKFISILGQWAPQWGTDASGTWETGPLVYRPTESVPDPPAIPAPPDAGDYLIHADTANLVYTVTPATNKLFLYGSATEAGLNHSKALPMVKTAPLRFEISTYLKGGENYSLGFLMNPNSNSGQYVMSENGRLKYVNTNFTENLISAPEEDGQYLIKVDLIKRRYFLIKE
jgi:hypothetical protein